MSGRDDRAGRALERLLEVMARLRHPVDGCPWDRAQTHASLTRYAIEEAYEVDDAVRRGDDADLKDELADLLFQPVFHAQIAKERGAFDFVDIMEAVVDKMVRRHPHVFAEASFRDRAEQENAWEAQKAAERAEKTRREEASALDGVPIGAPSLLRAMKLQKRAARVGFDWPAGDVEGPFDKVAEELAEIRACLRADEPQGRAAEEIGDLIFSAVNVARRLGVDAEEALREANAKFERRFRAMEDAAREAGIAIDGLSDAHWDGLWNRAKAKEKDAARS